MPGEVEIDISRDVYFPFDDVTRARCGVRGNFIVRLFLLLIGETDGHVIWLNAKRARVSAAHEPFLSMIVMRLYDLAHPTTHC